MGQSMSQVFVLHSMCLTKRSYSWPASSVQNTLLPCEIEAMCIATAVKHFGSFIVQSSQKTCMLTDNKPYRQAYEKLCREEFSSSPRVSTFLLFASRFQTTIYGMYQASTQTYSYQWLNSTSGDLCLTR